MIKNRNEPCKVLQIAEVISGLHEKDIEDVSRIIYQNTMKLFFPNLPFNDREWDASVS